jgi:hypothetical protein
MVSENPIGGKGRWGKGDMDIEGEETGAVYGAEHRGLRLAQPHTKHLKLYQTEYG